jgi:gliding motility-associated-like protein
VNSIILNPSYNFFYNFGDGNSINSNGATHSYEAPGIYLITQIVLNEFGCTDSTKNIVTIQPEFRFWIPNSFTPDNNSVNDIFMPVAIGVEKYEFDIFNRWGQKIFHTMDPNVGWDGTLKGIECQQDIYTWRISYFNVVDKVTEIKTGAVHLFRNP